MILIVGDTPAPKAKTSVPFKDAKCESRLNEWLGKLGLKRENCKIVNRTSDFFELAATLASKFGIPIIALGNNASRALGEKSHFKLPHPSGKNRQINNKSYISRQLAQCRLWLRHV